MQDTSLDEEDKDLTSRKERGRIETIEYRLPIQAAETIQVFRFLFFHGTLLYARIGTRLKVILPTCREGIKEWQKRILTELTSMF